MRNKVKGLVYGSSVWINCRNIYIDLYICVCISDYSYYVCFRFYVCIYLFLITVYVTVLIKNTRLHITFLNFVELSELHREVMRYSTQKKGDQYDLWY